VPLQALEEEEEEEEKGTVAKRTSSAPPPSFLSAVSEAVDGCKAKLCKAEKMPGKFLEDLIRTGTSLDNLVVIANTAVLPPPYYHCRGGAATVHREVAATDQEIIGNFLKKFRESWNTSESISPAEQAAKKRKRRATLLGTLKISLWLASLTV